MRLILFILFLFLSLETSAQQLIEICAEDSKTITYFSSSNGIGSNIWTVNGVSYPGEDLTYTFAQPGNYNIVLKRENGPCYVEESLQVVVTLCPETIYWVPNCFTPDSDENNQLFGPVMTEGFDINGFEFLVFNRWGNVVWESQDPNGRWDGTYNGKKCNDGVYIWKIQFNVFDNDSKILDHGHLTIIR